MTYLLYILIVDKGASWDGKIWCSAKEFRFCLISGSRYICQKLWQTRTMNNISMVCLEPKFCAYFTFLSLQQETAKLSLSLIKVPAHLRLFYNCLMYTLGSFKFYSKNHLNYTMQQILENDFLFSTVTKTLIKTTILSKILFSVKK